MKAHWLIPIPMMAIGVAAGYLSQPIDGAGGANPDHAVTTNFAHGDQRLPKDGPEVQRDIISQKLRSALAYPSQLRQKKELAALLCGLSFDELMVVAGLLDGLPKDDRSILIKLLVFELAKRDPVAAARFAERVPDEKNGNLILIVASEWAKTNPEAALRWFARYPGEARSFDSRLVEQIKEFAKKDPRAATELVLSDIDSFGRSSLQDAFEAWSKDDPVAAIGRAAEIKNWKDREAALVAAARGWVANAPDAALAWFRQVDDPKLRTELAPSMAVGIAKNDLAAGLELAQSLPEGRLRDSAIAGIADSLRLSGRKSEAIELVRDLPFDRRNLELRMVLMGSLVENPSSPVLGMMLDRVSKPDVDPDERQDLVRFLVDDTWQALVRPAEDAAKLVRAIANWQTESPIPVQAQMIEKLSHLYASGDVSEARTWAETLPVGMLRESALFGFTVQWVSSSRVAAEQWIDSLPPSADRDAAVSGFVRGTIAQDSSAALARLNEISDPGRRASALQSAWNSWLRRNRKAAEKWRDSASGLNATDRNLLQSGGRR